MHLAAFSDSHTNRLSLNTRFIHHTEDSQSVELRVSNETLFKLILQIKSGRYHDSRYVPGGAVGTPQ